MKEGGKKPTKRAAQPVKPTKSKRIQVNSSKHTMDFEWEDSGEPTALIGCMLQNWRLDFPHYEEVSNLLRSSIKQAIIKVIVDEDLPLNSLDFKCQIGFPMNERGSLN